MRSGMHDAVVCKQCGGTMVEEGYDLPLCGTCRTALSCRPFPVWIGVTAGIVVLVFVFALTRLPDSLRAGSAYEKGQVAVASGNYPTAVREFARVAKLYPNSAEVRARLAIAYGRSGDRRGFVSTVDTLQDQELPERLVDEIEQIGNELGLTSFITATP
jgi:hypothetical protein